MRVHSTDGGKEACQDVINCGYSYGNEIFGLTDAELDELRVVCDPLFGADELKPEEVGGDPTRHAIFRKLAALGLVRIEE